MFVAYMVSALRPDDFRISLRTRLTYEENKNLRANVIELYSFAIEQLCSYVLWRSAATTRNQKQPDASDNSTRGVRNTYGSGRREPLQAAAGGTSIRCADGQWPTKAGEGQAGGSDSSSMKPEHQFACQKCGSFEYRVRRCPKVAYGEVERTSV